MAGTSKAELARQLLSLREADRRCLLICIMAVRPGYPTAAQNFSVDVLIEYSGRMKQAATLSVSK